MHKSKAALFLMELLIVLLFFSIACAVCIQLFSDAHITNKRSKEYSNSNIIYTNLAEEFYDADLQDSNDTIYYDANLGICSANQADYKAVTSVSHSDRMWTYHISISGCDNNYEYINREIIRYERRAPLNE